MKLGRVVEPWSYVWTFLSPKLPPTREERGVSWASCTFPEQNNQRRSLEMGEPERGILDTGLD